MKFESAEEVALWCEVYVAAIKTGMVGPGATSDKAVTDFRARIPEEEEEDETED